MSEFLENDSFPGKIAVITVVPSIKEDDFHSPDRLIAKYGDDKIIHLTWPENFMAEQEKMISTVAELVPDPDIKVLIITQVLTGTNAAVKKLKETRGDIYIIYGSIQESLAESAANANLIFDENILDTGRAMVKQAKKQGAKVFVHYSFPRHMADKRLAGRRDKILETCAEEKLQFIDLTVLDPAGEAGLAGAQEFIKHDVPKVTAQYGKDTAFFCSNCHLQGALIKAVVESHAILPQPCCPSPFHGFPEALGLNTGKGMPELNMLINDISNTVMEKNMSDRLSTWPVSLSTMYTNAGAEYAIKWLREEVPNDHIDNRVLMECLNSYIEEVIGEESYVHMTSYTDGDKTYNNFKLILMSYLDF